jgi:hypothetical protein
LRLALDGEQRRGPGDDVVEDLTTTDRVERRVAIRLRVLTCAAAVLVIVTRRSGSSTGSGRISSAFTRLKIAVVAPIPSATDTVAAIETIESALPMRLTTAGTLISPPPPPGELSRSPRGGDWAKRNACSCRVGVSARHLR